MGPQGACTNWIEKNLGAREHLAVTMNSKGFPAQRAILRALARLFVHRVPMDLSPLYADLPG